jgi:MarR family 2-MHQ and catechol resistance regulon transcriptional repressor
LSTAQPDSDRELSLKLFVVLAKAHKVIMDAAVKDMRKHGLSPTEFAILELLYHKGRFPLQQIGGHILMTSGSITYNIDKLETKGSLRRIPCPDDRRVTYAEITDEGSRLFNEIFPKHAEVIESVLHGLAPSEKEEAIRLIKKMGLAASNSTEK